MLSAVNEYLLSKEKMDDREDMLAEKSGAGDRHSDFYRRLAANYMLDYIVRMPTFASGSMGSGGVMLTRGQPQS
jgi:hypothetical protein